MVNHRTDSTAPVDGLRGLAILLVVLRHSYTMSSAPEPPGLQVLEDAGYLGVDLFFIVSGFCLFYPYAKAAFAGSPRMKAAEFFRRRALKIVPSYILAYGVTIATSIAIGVNNIADWQWLGGNLLQHALFVNNSQLDYFPPDASNPVFYTIAVEVQFYLLVPLLAKINKPIFTAIALIAIANAYRLANLLVFLPVAGVRDVVFTRELPAYLDLFACGMIAAYALVCLRAKQPRPILYTTASVALTAAFWALLVSCAGTRWATDGRVLWEMQHRTLFAGVVAALIVASCLALPA